jgi:hypothetical protein
MTANLFLIVTWFTITPFLNLNMDAIWIALDKECPLPGPKIEKWKEFNVVTIMHFESEDEFFFRAGMTIDADGAPNAYHPDPAFGLDDLKNAGCKGNWKGIATDESGEPCIQDPDDPFPGYYISTTSLYNPDPEIGWCDPRKYVDATEIPYIVLPLKDHLDLGASPGCLAIVFNMENELVKPAIFADYGPETWLGEGSIRLVNDLKLEIKYSCDPKYKDMRITGGGGDIKEMSLIYLVFPQSGSGKPLTSEEIEKEAFRLYDEWGGIDRLRTCFPEIKN